MSAMWNDLQTMSVDMDTNILRLRELGSVFDTARGNGGVAMKRLSRLFCVLGLAVFIPACVPSVNAQPRVEQPRVQPFVCGGGESRIEQLPDGTRFGIGGSANFARPRNPANSGASVGYCVPDIEPLPGVLFRGLSIVVVADQAAINNTVTRFCFQNYDDEDEIATEEVPLSAYRKTQERGVFHFYQVENNNANFKSEFVRRGNGQLLAVQVFLRSSGSTTSANYGSIDLVFNGGDFEPHDIVFANGGCSAIGQCRKTFLNNKRLLIDAKREEIRNRRGR